MGERDYVLCTHDAEIDRLGLQHRLWRARMLDAFRVARIGPGQTVLDVGAGPGFATADLAEIVGPGGRVVALERSARFLRALEVRARALGLANVEAREVDVVADEFPITGADAAWCRWVLSFVTDPPRVIGRIRAALRTGATAVFHEYLDYGAWRVSPPVPEQERFAARVMQSWRDGGGEPDVGRHLPAWLVASGFELLQTRLQVELLAPGDPLWRWIRAFVDVGSAREAELGHMTAIEVAALRLAMDAAEALPQTRMTTPIVLEVIARAA